MGEQEIAISFQDVSLPEANGYAAELEERLRDSVLDVQIARKSDMENTQDFGATLVLVLGTTAVTAIARGIEEWLKRRPNCTLTIKENGEVIFTGNSEDASRIAMSLKKK